MNKNWAYRFALNHDGAGVGTIYYAAKYFDQENITNPASAEAYTTDEINTIKASAEKGEDGYRYDVPDGAVIGMNVLNTDKVFWYDEDNSAKITACTNPLSLDKTTGEMKDMDGNLVASAM